MTVNPRAAVLELPNDISAIETAVERAVDCCTTARLARNRLMFNFRVGLTEALSNAILYGNGGDPQKRVRVELRVRSGEVRARVTDEGKGFDPDAVPDPRLPENIPRPDGRGIFLMRALMDEVHYNELGNSVTLVLREGTPAAP
ncbi:MAG: ATP-binding protein [Gemmatimonadetes bacterium]|nr:ATP-binding protein [Gemmatimonadota bacterium]MYE92224.1 ATP-binding protein [Gemmatimonadota bacterium]MYJ10797.1 ATP-binding protein [Gemmatimonadota bacterium]